MLLLGLVMGKSVMPTHVADEPGLCYSSSGKDF
jgi:hypothetical protein